MNRTMKHHQKIDRLAKFLSYVLGRQPDEFGLVADEHGWVRLKDLIKALGEEPGWRHVRRHEIRDLTLTHGPPAIEIDDELLNRCDVLIWWGHVRQHEIENDQVVTVGHGQVQPGDAVGRVVDLVPAVLEVVAYHRGDVVVIFDEQDLSGQQPDERPDISDDLSPFPSGDPDFDAGQRAFYYVRVLEIPTPRWVAYDAFRASHAADPAPDLPLWRVAVAEGRMVGVACASGRNAEDAGGWVADLGVLASHRGRGIARALLQAAFEADPIVLPAWDPMGSLA